MSLFGNGNARGIPALAQEMLMQYQPKCKLGIEKQEGHFLCLYNTTSKTQCNPAEVSFLEQGINIWSCIVTGGFNGPFTHGYWAHTYV